MRDARQIRINELARELEVKAKAIVDYLPEVGVTEKKTFSSLIDVEAAVKVREHFRAIAEKEVAEAAAKVSAKIGAQTKQVLITMPQAFAVLSSTMAALQNAPSFSEYIRGLIVLDALITQGKTEEIEISHIPSWLLAAYPASVIKKMRELYIESHTSAKKGIDLSKL